MWQPRFLSGIPNFVGPNVSANRSGSRMTVLTKFHQIRATDFCLAKPVENLAPAKKSALV